MKTFLIIRLNSNITFYIATVLTDNDVMA